MGRRSIFITIGSLVALGSVTLATAASAAGNGPQRRAEPTSLPQVAVVAPSAAAASTDGGTSSAPTGVLSVSYDTDGADTITVVVSSGDAGEGGGAVVAQATLQGAAAHQFALPGGSYVVDVTQSSDVVTSGDVAISSAVAQRFAPVDVSAGAMTDVRCSLSGCEVR